MAVVGTIWPDGSYGFSFANRRPLDEISPPLHLSPDSIAAEEQFLRGYHESGLSLSEYKSQQLSACALDLANVPISNKPPSPRAKRGSGGITSYGRKVVRCSATLLQNRTVRSCLVFQTLTLPEISLEEARHLARNWSHVVHLYTTRLRRSLARRGLPQDYVGVSEIQPQRYADSGVPALHLHLVFVGRLGTRPNSPWLIPLAEHDANWKAAVETVLGRAADFTRAAQTQAVKKSAAAYLAKYLSKGAPVCASQQEGGSPPADVDSHPSAWYFVSRSLKKLVLDTRLRCTAFAAVVAPAIFSGAIPSVYRKTIDLLTPDGASFPIGFYGRLTAAATEQVHAYYYAFLATLPNC